MKKKVFKLLVLLFVICFVFYGCKKKQQVDPTPQVDPIDVIDPVDDDTPKEEKLTDKVTIEDNGYVAGENGNKYALLKIMNRNSIPVTVIVDIKYNNGTTEKLSILVGVNKYSYVIAKNTKDTIAYDYTFDAAKDAFEDYNNIYNAIKLGCTNTGTNLILTIENNSTQTINPKVLMFFKKNDEIVAVKEVKVDNIAATDVKKETIEYPVGSGQEKISFDKVQVLLNEL